MTIQEILRQHQISDDLNCECGYNYDQHNPNEETFEVIYTTHQAEVLDKHMQEREAAVLLKARDRMAKHWPLALDEFEAGEVCDWLEHEADKIKETPNGR